MDSFSEKLSKLAEENEIMSNEFDEIKKKVVEFVKKFPIGQYEDKLIELLTMIDCPKDKIEGIKMIRSGKLPNP